MYKKIILTLKILVNLIIITLAIIVFLNGILINKQYLGNINTKAFFDFQYYIFEKDYIPSSYLAYIVQYKKSANILLGILSIIFSIYAFAKSIVSIYYDILFFDDNIITVKVTDLTSNKNIINEIQQKVDKKHYYGSEKHLPYELKRPTEEAVYLDSERDKESEQLKKTAENASIAKKEPLENEIIKAPLTHSMLEDKNKKLLEEAIETKKEVPYIPEEEPVEKVKEIKNEEIADIKEPRAKLHLSLKSLFKKKDDRIITKGISETAFRELVKDEVSYEDGTSEKKKEAQRQKERVRRQMLLKARHPNTKGEVVFLQSPNLISLIKYLFVKPEPAPSKKPQPAETKTERDKK